MLKFDIQMFALSGTGPTGTGTSCYQQTRWTATQSIANNSSTIVGEIWYKKITAGTYTIPSGSYGIVSIDGSNHGVNPSGSVSTTWKKVASYTASVTHLADGTRTVAISTSSQAQSNCGTVTLNTIPRAVLTTVPTFAMLSDIGITDLVILNTQYSEYDYDLELIIGGTTISRSSISNTTYNLSLTQEEKDSICAEMATVNYISATMTLTIEFAEGVPSTKTGTISLAGGYMPTTYPFLSEDVDAETLALTGNNQTAIKGYTNVKLTVPVASKAVGNRGASIVSYRFACGEQQTTLAYSETEDVSATFNNILSNYLQVYTIDSRGNSVQNYDGFVPYYEYVIPTITSGEATRTDNIEEETTLEMTGTYFAQDFGDVTNSATVTYEYKKTTEPTTWTAGTTVLTPTIVDNAISLSQVIVGDKEGSGFDTLYSYNIKITVTDELSSATYDVILPSAVPNIAIHQLGVAINAPYDEVLGGTLQVDGIDVGAALTDSGWQTMTLVNNWVSYDDGTTYPLPHYRKIGNQVFIKGMIKNPSTVDTTTRTFFTLPEGYRPLKATYLMVASNAFFSVTVSAAGVMNVDRTIYAANNYVAIDSISFFTD